MATPALTDAQINEAVEARQKHPSDSAAARALGLSQGAFSNRLRRAAERGLLGTKPVLPGFRISQVTSTPNGDFVQQRPERGEEFEIPIGHAVKGVSALVDAEGRTVQQWVKTREGVLDPLAIAEWLKDAFIDVKTPKRIAAPIHIAADLLTLLPCNDWHVGMFAWGKETQANWDLKIAEKVIGDAIEDTVTRSPKSAEGVVLGGGDLLHADNGSNQTTNQTRVDVEGRYRKVVETANRLKVRAIDAMLRQHRRVTVRVLPGNHDEHSSVAVAYFLLAYYRNEPRVTVDVDPSRFFWKRFGQVMLGATHGDYVKIGQMPGVMAHRRAEDWGKTRFRYVHGFHLHHSAKFATEGEGVISEVHQAPVPQDAWHFNSGFLSGRSVQAITYHREFGEISRSRTAIMDAKEAA